MIWKWRRDRLNNNNNNSNNDHPGSKETVGNEEGSQEVERVDGTRSESKGNGDGGINTDQQQEQQKHQLRQQQFPPSLTLENASAKRLSRRDSSTSLETSHKANNNAHHHSGGDGGSGLRIMERAVVATHSILEPLETGTKVLLKSGSQALSHFQHHHHHHPHQRIQTPIDQDMNHQQQQVNHAEGSKKPSRIRKDSTSGLMMPLSASTMNSSSDEEDYTGSSGDGMDGDEEPNLEMLMYHPNMHHQGGSSGNHSGGHSRSGSPGALRTGSVANGDGTLDRRYREMLTENLNAQIEIWKVQENQMQLRH
jgi:hypothetical protein